MFNSFINKLKNPFGKKKSLINQSQNQSDIPKSSNNLTMIPASPKSEDNQSSPQIPSAPNPSVPANSLDHSPNPNPLSTPTPSISTESPITNPSPTPNDNQKNNIPPSNPT